MHLTCVRHQSVGCHSSHISVHNVTQTTFGFVISAKLKKEQVWLMFSQSSTHYCWHPFMNNCISVLCTCACVHHFTMTEKTKCGASTALWVSWRLYAQLFLFESECMCVASAVSPDRMSLTHATVGPIGLIPSSSPPLVIPAGTVESICQLHYWFTCQSQHYMFPHTHRKIHVSVEDVHLHLPGAASCTPSLPNSSRRREAVHLHLLLSSLSPWPLLCNYM